MPTYTPNITEKYIYGDFINVMNLRDFQTLNIYVNSVTGRDTGPGRGSSSSPYKSFKFALNNAFTLINNAQVVIHLAGAADHELPADYVFPAILSQDEITLEPDPLFGFNKRGPLVIRATPTLVATLTAPEILSQSNNAISGLKRLTTGGGLVSGALAGKWAQDSEGALARVSTNGTDTVDLAYAGQNLVPPILFYEEGATITPQDPGSHSPTVVIRGGTAPIIFFGVAIQESVAGAVRIGAGQQVSFIACDITYLEAGVGINSLLNLGASVECIACNLAGLSLPAASLSLQRSRFSAGTFETMAHNSRVNADQCYFTDMESPCFSDGTSSPGEIRMSNCAVYDSVGHGVQVIGGLLDMSTCDVARAGVNGIFGLRQSSLKLTAVGSSEANTESGIYLQNGSVCEVDADTDLTGDVHAILLGVDGVNFSTFAIFRTGASPYSVMVEGENSSIWQGAQGGSPSSVPLPVVVDETPYNQKSSDVYLLVDATVEPITINLLALAGFAGKTLVIKKIDESVNSVRVQADGIETIDGESFRDLQVQYQSITILSGTFEWSVI